MRNSRYYPVSIGIMAYNEDKNIGHLLESIFNQKLNKIIIKEIIIVSSGSTDKTNQIIKSYVKKSPKIKLFIQRKRQGKSSAVNVFMSEAKSGLIVLVSADLLLEESSLENLVSPFKDSDVGIVGSHPIPLNNPNSFMGYTAHLLWNLHHQVSLNKPKMGEMVAFRKIFKKIPILSAVDEVNIEALIRGQGYKAVYAPKAIVYNKGPENLLEFIAQRRRIFAGHLAANYEYSYEVSTMSGWRILHLIVKAFKPNWRFFFWIPVVILLEVYCRMLGLLDYKFKLRNHTVWQTSPSTKKLALSKS
jgi:poly-beta-1,6-N-acetyl-D-glucosamine synthase